MSYALFERHVLQPAALDIYGQPLARVEHVGSFACRNVYNREDGRRSQHASANALDISGFRLADGRRIRLATDWAGESADGRFLRRVRDGACASFNAVLGPDYNAAHRGSLPPRHGPMEGLPVSACGSTLAKSALSPTIARP